ncbi:hypothetical protein [Amycolatopsis keratiniphila]|nr:hypothetical protein [Amycolatopsis keratiniphila]SDU35700.1 hypothetical protein SAMN04489733_3363 [Amycolatopsis keratiniphila]
MNGASGRQVSLGVAHLTAPPTVPTPDCGDLVLSLTDLSVLTGKVSRYVEQLRFLLADRPTVTAHLQQAQSYAGDLRRKLDHAAGMLAYNTGCDS